MKFFVCVYGVAMCYAFIRGGLCMKEDISEEAHDSKERRDDIIQEVVRSLLGVKEVSESDGSPRRTPPRYMLDLYDRYKSGQTPVQGNTVRSILPMRGKLKGVDMLVFNLTGIHAEEQILQGKLHIFRRRQSRRGNNGGGGRKREAVRLKIADLSLKSPPYWVDVPRQKNSGWQSFDVTEVVIQCRTAQHDGDHLLGVSSELRRPNGKYKPIPIRRISRLSSQPFLIIFSEDRNNRTVNSTMEQETVSTNYEEIREMLLSQRNMTEDQRSLEGSPLPRHKRFVRPEMHVNYLPNIDDNMDEYTEPEHGKNGSTNDNRKDYSKNNHRRVDTSSVPTIVSKDSEPEESKKPSQRGRKNKRKKQKEKTDVRFGTDRKCQRKDLIVDFSVLGWNDWIVLPQTFNAYYCSGSCVNPLSQINFSNHALIQSVLHANKDFRVNSEKLPAPCCVPTSTKSLEVFYVNKVGMTLLRNFPDMIVESCACR